MVREIISSFATLLVCSVSAVAQSPLAVPVDGEPFEARLTSVDAQGKLGFDVAGKPRTLAAADLVSWGHPAELRKGPILVLADGGYLPAAVLAAEKADLSVDSARLGPLKLPLDSLAGIVFRPPPHPAELDALLDRVARGQGQTDRLILDNGDEVTGLIERDPGERQAQDQRQSRAGGGCRPPRRGAGLQSGLAAAARRAGQAAGAGSGSATAPACWPPACNWKETRWN